MSCFKLTGVVAVLSLCVALFADDATIDCRRERFSFPDDGAACRVDGAARAAAIGVKSSEKGFTLKLDFELPKDHQRPRVVAKVAGAFEIALHPVDPKNRDWNFDWQQHYAGYPLADGSVAALEGRFLLHSERHPEWKEIRAGVSAAKLAQGRHEVLFLFDGVRVRVFADGALADENFPFGEVVWPADAKLEVADACVKAAALWSPAALPKVSVSRETVAEGIQYFRPRCGAWIGDVVPYAHDGTMHVFYLLDRRHHGSKWGQGAHYWGHLSSRDLLHWTEHENFGEFDTPFESCGTGTPFFHNGKLHFAYGLHTERFVPWRENAASKFHAEAEATGRITSARTFEELAPLFPGGMTYAVSDDGERFRKSRKITHFATNPSVYTLEDGSLKMYANGIWKAKQVDGPWERVSATFPPHNRTAPMRNSLECPSYFTWGGWHYMIVGITGFYSSATADFTEYRDLALEGRDIYGGETVPMVVPFGNDRRLMMGWIAPFGSYLVIRELVQLENHELGVKWCPEVQPRFHAKTALPAGPVVDRAAPACALYETTVDGTRGGKVGVRFASAVAGVPGVEFTLDLDAATAQYSDWTGGDAFPAPIPTVREVMASEEGQKADYFRKLPWDLQSKLPYSARAYRLENLHDLKTTFPLRIIVKHDPTMPCTLVDAEIAGKRTMVALRPHLKVSEIATHVAGGAAFGPFMRHD